MFEFVPVFRYNKTPIVQFLWNLCGTTLLDYAKVLSHYQQSQNLVAANIYCQAQVVSKQLPQPALVKPSPSQAQAHLCRG